MEKKTDFFCHSYDIEIINSIYLNNMRQFQFHQLHETNAKKTRIYLIRVPFILGCLQLWQRWTYFFILKIYSPRFFQLDFFPFFFEMNVIVTSKSIFNISCNKLAHTRKKNPRNELISVFLKRKFKNIYIFFNIYYKKKCYKIFSC